MRSAAGLFLRLFLVFLFTLVLKIDAYAAEGDAQTITLDEAYRMAVETHEGVRIAAEGVSQAQSTVGKATSRILPSVTAEGSYTRYSEQKSSGSFITQPEHASKVELKMTQPLYSGGKEWATRRQANYKLESSREGLEAAKEDIIFTAAKAYFGVLKAEKDVEIKRSALKRAGERSKVAAARFNVGEVTKSAVLRAEAEAAGAEAELTKSENTLGDSKNTLKRIIGATGEIQVAEPLPLPPGYTPAGVDEFINKALASRRDYRRSLLSQNAAEEGVSIAKSGFLPSLKFEGLFSWKEQDPETTFFQENSASATVVLTYPIFEGFLRKEELKESRSIFREAELKRLGLKRDIEIEVREAYNNLDYYRAVIESYKKQLSFAEEDYNMVFEQFKFGLATTIDVIDADTILISAQRSLMNARYDQQLAIVNLKYSVGVLLDETLGVKNEAR